MNKFKTIIRNIKYGIPNLIYYFKTIWYDRQWDFSCIEDMLLAKYKRMYKFRTQSNNVMKYEGIEKDNQALKICIDILERRRDLWYIEIWSHNYGKHLKIDFVTIEYTDSKFVKFEETKSDEMNEDYNKKRYHDQVEERDWRIYCDLVKNYHQRWWD